jgi:hypothetical protein
VPCRPLICLCLCAAGPEPEGLTTGPCGEGSSKLCLFLGAESSSVIYVFDISDPTKPVFQSMGRPPQPDSGDVLTRLTAPEGITYARWAQAQMRGQMFSATTIGHFFRNSQ